MTNEQCDCAILERLKSGTYKFHQLYATLHFAFGPDKAIYRQIDSRLQSLRKSGKVTFSHGFGWSLK